MKTLGLQTMLELYGCNSALLDDTEYIRQIMLTAAEKANATIVQQFFHQFSPFGVSGTVVIAESHINIHTWPEHRFTAIDLFTCGTDMNISAACDYLTRQLEASEYTIDSLSRGSMATIQRVNEEQTQHHRR